MPYRKAPRKAVRILVRLGDELRQARYAKGLSQSALAAHASVDQSTVSRFERGLAPGLRVSRYALMLAIVRPRTDVLSDDADLLSNDPDLLPDNADLLSGEAGFADNRRLAEERGIADDRDITGRPDHPWQLPFLRW